MGERITTTAAGLARLMDELAELEGPARRAIAERIKTAREWGDLKENSEYHDAKNDQAHLETRIARLRERTADAILVEETAATDTIGYGATVTVVDDTGRESTWRIVASHEAAGSTELLSVESPVARALTGATVGDEVVVALPRGERRLRVLNIA